jgi:hypothetical protein
MRTHWFVVRIARPRGSDYRAHPPLLARDRTGRLLGVLAFTDGPRMKLGQFAVYARARIDGDQLVLGRQLPDQGWPDQEGDQA